MREEGERSVPNVDFVDGEFLEEHGRSRTSTSTGVVTLVVTDRLRGPGE